VRDAPTVTANTFRASGTRQPATTRSVGALRQGDAVRPDYHEVILGSVPDRCESALDVGCGTGLLTRRLRVLVPTVTGIDTDRRSIEVASTHPMSRDITYLRGDFLTWPFPAESFGLIGAVASLHHMDAAAALTRMRDLVRPGGVVAIVGLARAGSPVDVALTVPATIGVWFDRVARRRSAIERDGYTAPLCWPPPVTYRDMRRLAGQLLPGAHYRRHLYWRYSLTWTKPS
jgi:SAM-dependent methyltransferase